MESSKLWFLKRINLFRCLDDDELEELSRMAQHRRLRRHEMVFGPRDLGDAIYLLKQGRIKLSRFEESGKEITLAILEEGEFFGEEALAKVGQRRACAEALDEGLVCRIDRDDFEKLLQKNPGLALAVTRQLSERLLGAQDRLEGLAFHDVPRRLAVALLGMAEKPFFGQRTALRQRITHQELASLVGSTRETTTTQLGRFKREGLLESEGRQLFIVDRVGLEKVAAGG